MEEKTISEYFKERKEAIDKEIAIVSDVKSAIDDLKKESDYYIRILEDVNKENKKKKCEFEEKGYEHYSNLFIGTHGSSDKAHLRRMIEVTETKLRRLRRMI